MPAYLPIVSKFDNKGINSAIGGLKNFAAQAIKAGAAATAALGSAAVFSIKKFADFDSALQQSVAIMGDVSDALRDDMAKAAREVAKETTFSAEQAAESFYFLASAGLDAEASIAAMPQVAKFAQAGMFDMALATDLLTDAQSALGLTIRDDAVANMQNMTKVSDVLVKANTLANASVEQFSTALTTKAGPAMKAVGMDIEEGVAVLAAFADQGIKAEVAGTNFAIVLRDLQTKAINNAEDFKKLNVAVFDSQGEMRNMADILADLEGALEGSSDETKKATLAQLGFSDKSMASLTALLGLSDQIRTYEGELRNAGNTTQDVAEKQLETAKAQFELLKSRIEDVAIQIGAELTPYIMTLVEEIGPLIDNAAPVAIELFKNLADNVKTLGERFKPHIDELIPNLTKLFEDMNPFFESAGELILAIAETSLKALNDLLEDPTFQAAFKTFNDAMTYLVDEATELVNSELVQYLLDLGGKAVSSGLFGTGQAINAIAGALGSMNDALGALEGRAQSFSSIANNFKNMTGIDLSSLVEGFLQQYMGRFKGGFADGGIVKARPGGILGVIGEGGRDEAIIPLDQAGNLTYGQGGNTYNININAGIGSDPVTIGRYVTDAIKRYESVSGKVFASA